MPSEARDVNMAGYKERDELLDVLKGFAMVMTIFCHALQRTVGNDCTNYVIWGIVYQWNMPIFFMISGYLASHSKKLGTAEFIKEKFFRLIYVWLIWRWLEWIFMPFAFSGLSDFNSYVPTSALGNLLFFFRQPFRPMWFLFDLFLFFLLLCVCKWLSYNKNNWMIIFLLILIALSVVGYYVCRLYGNVYGFSYNGWGFLYYDIQYFGLFGFGFLLGEAKQNLLKRGQDAQILATSSVVAAVLLVLVYQLILFPIFGEDLKIFDFWGRAVIWSIIIAILFKIIFKREGKIGKWFCDCMAYMGRNSMEYYTIQFLCLDCGYAITNIYLHWGINFAACMLICTIIIILVKKYIPWLNKALWGGFYQGR